MLVSRHERSAPCTWLKWPFAASAPARFWWVPTEAIVIAMKRDDNLVVFAGNSLHNQQHVRLAVRNAEHAKDRLGLFFPTLIQCLNDIADRWICGVPHVLK
jgi:hypothetical protein